MKKRLPNILKALGNISFAVVMALIFSLTPVRPAFADLTQDQIDAIYNNWPSWVVDDDIICAGNSDVPTGGPTNTIDSSGGSWNSGQQPPYILESFFIEVLKDIAQKRGVDPMQTTLTEEHVIALVAFAIGEGGDINNHDIFNPLNTGINAPDLASTAHNASGLQSFKSFDAGVEANARVMTGNNQRRLSDILIQKASTADEFMKALTYFNNYPGNKLWAEASLPPNDQSYYQERLHLVAQVRRDYNNTAGLILGTPALEFQTHQTDPSKLVYHPSGGGASTSTGSTSVSAGPGCTCTAAPATTDGSNVIVIDPGHSIDDSTVKNGGKPVVDPATGLLDYDYPNKPEIYEVYKVAEKVRDKLTKDGYKVIMTKPSADSDASFRARANLANDNHAALAISIHDQSGNPGGLPFANQNNFVYVQKMGLHRDKADGTQIKFGTPPAAGGQAVADTSAKYGQIFADARTAAEGHKVTVTTASIDRGAKFSPGNIWMVQLFSNVPWIYNEVGGNSAGQSGLSDTDQNKYANGLVAGVEKSVPLAAGAATTAPAATTTIAPAGGCGGGSGTAGKFTDTIRAYAWPTYHSAPYVDPYNQKMKPEYLAAVKAAVARHDYVGGGQYPGVDCGGFVTLVYHDSGADPNYNKYKSNVVAQQRYLNEVSSGPGAKYQKMTNINSASDLRKGDIFINSDASHTYIFVGAGVFSGYDSASASFSTSGSSWRTPMASKAYDFKAATWYRPLFPLN
ncbi:MAG TPA: N-acetylmuramoyl-L-alanine amidase [Candidatus Saccharimonadales bacterium]|jgi:N-acetylmuramoyl-L-alanine amidase|nr:N-acetylmuramoyl-L-alanine amidase [Candidatus Saccharimonadales bacterium]